MRQVRDFPTYAEIQALERAARRAQAEEMYRLATLSASRLKALAVRFAAGVSRAIDQPSALRTGAGSVGSHAPATLLSILENLSASLPDDLRERHAAELATAMRVAPAIDLAVALWDFTVRVVAGAIRTVAQGLRAGAWCLDLAARRLMPLAAR